MHQGSYTQLLIIKGAYVVLSYTEAVPLHEHIYFTLEVPRGISCAVQAFIQSPDLTFLSLLILRWQIDEQASRRWGIEVRPADVVDHKLSAPTPRRCVAHYDPESFNWRRCSIQAVVLNRVELSAHES